jgi:acyl-coenzyme A synthetase/AMP-(fatty) acid ligase
MGRKDAQVKIRGQRIELGEFEYHLSRAEHVVQSVAVFPKSGIYKSNLVAILRDYVSEKIPVHMVPVVWIVAEKIPQFVID